MNQNIKRAFDLYLTSLKIRISSHTRLLTDYIFLKFNKDYVSMTSEKGKERLLFYKESTEDLSEKLACNLLLYDFGFALSLKSDLNYSDDEKDNAFRLMKDIKKIVKVK